MVASSREWQTGCVTKGQRITRSPKILISKPLLALAFVVVLIGYSTIGKSSEAGSKDSDFIEQFRKAAKKKDGVFILSRVAKDFRIERDFGGFFNSEQSGAANFARYLNLDDTLLSPEYRGVGWRALATMLRNPLTPHEEPEYKHELCTTPDDFDADFPSTRILQGGMKIGS